LAKVCLFLHIGVTKGFNQTWLSYKMTVRQELKVTRIYAFRRTVVVMLKQFKILGSALVLCSLLFFVVASYAQSEVLGEIQFAGATKVEKTSGVWVDGQYVGYLKELKGSKKVLLLPGEHEIAVRQSGYKDFTQKVLLEPGQKQILRVVMEKDPRVELPAVSSEVKIMVTPNRAAVFLDEGFVGHVHEFGGTGRAMLVSPGKHRIKIALPGYQTFETEINLLPNQKFKIETVLVKGSITQAGTLIKP